MREPPQPTAAYHKLLAPCQCREFSAQSASSAPFAVQAAPRNPCQILSAHHASAWPTHARQRVNSCNGLQPITLGMSLSGRRPPSSPCGTNRQGQAWSGGRGTGRLASGKLDLELHEQFFGSRRAEFSQHLIVQGRAANPLLVLPRQLRELSRRRRLARHHRVHAVFSHPRGGRSHPCRPSLFPPSCIPSHWVASFAIASGP